MSRNANLQSFPLFKTALQFAQNEPLELLAGMTMHLYCRNWFNWCPIVISVRNIPTVVLVAWLGFNANEVSSSSLSIVKQESSSVTKHGYLLSLENVHLRTCESLQMNRFFWAIYFVIHAGNGRKFSVEHR
jgi:hypothetical protein